MGFRSYIREFLVAILMLFRPSLPWCFPIRELSFEQKEQQEQEQQQQKEKVTKKSSFSMGFRSYIRQFLVAILMLFRPSGPCCLSVAEAPFLSLEIPIRELSFEQKEYQEQDQQQQQQEEKVAKKSSLSMGFRSYIRQFSVAILMLFRPSGPCCLSVAEAPFLSLES